MAQEQGHRSQGGQYIGFAADQLEALGRRLRDSDIDGLIAEAAALGRRSPATFLAGAIAAGFLASRFLKSPAGQTDAAPAGRRADLGSGTVRWHPVDDPTHQDLLDPGDAPAPTSASEAYRHEAEPYVVGRGTAGAPSATPSEELPFPTTQRMPRATGGRHDI